MRTHDVPYTGPALDAPAVNGTRISLRKAIATAAAALALLGADIADAGIVRLPAWVDSLRLRGGMDGPVSTGGMWDYSFNDDQWNILFSGTGILWAPIAGRPYEVRFEAEREGTGEVLSMIMKFENLRFITASNFEAWNFNVVDGFNTLWKSNYVESSWDNTGFGDIWMIGTAYLNAIPEPSSVALTALGLGVVWGIAARRRKSAPGATPGEEKPETPAV